MAEDRKIKEIEIKEFCKFYLRDVFVKCRKDEIVWKSIADITDFINQLSKVPFFEKQIEQKLEELCLEKICERMVREDAVCLYKYIAQEIDLNISQEKDEIKIDVQPKSLLEMMLKYGSSGASSEAMKARLSESQARSLQTKTSTSPSKTSPSPTKVCSSPSKTCPSLAKTSVSPTKRCPSDISNICPSPTKKHSSSDTPCESILSSTMTSSSTSEICLSTSLEPLAKEPCIAQPALGPAISSRSEPLIRSPNLRPSRTVSDSQTLSPRSTSNSTTRSASADNIKKSRSQE